MARKRMISPSVWEDPSFNKLSIPARLLFIGLISNADDDGYLRGDEGSLRRLIFGFDSDAEMKVWIKELKTFKNIHFYESNGEEYCHLFKWNIHQNQREDRRVPSVYPLCGSCQTNVSKLRTNVRQLPAEGSKEVSKLSKGGYRKFLEAKKQIGKI